MILVRATLAAAFCLPLWGQIRIAVIGDQTGSSDLQSSYRILESGVAAINRLSPGCQVALHVGDLVESRRGQERIREDFARAVALLDQLNCPWHLTPGDHDVNPQEYRLNSPDRSREKLFQELYAKRRPQIGNRLYYSFDAAGYHFIALYSMEHLHADPRWGDVFLARISDEQLQWLEADLKKSRDAKGIVVFTHQPLWYNWSGWYRVHRLLASYRVALVVAGHFHFTQMDSRLDGVQYLVVGASGGVTKQANAEAGGMQAVFALELTGRRLTDFRVLPLEGSQQPAALPTRSDMDRAQAVEYALDQLISFPPANPVFQRNGHLVGDCRSGRSAKLVLRQTGNAIDLPLRIDIELPRELVREDSARFLPGACLTIRSRYSCDLAPGVNIAIANPSLVQSIRDAAQALWESTLVADVPQGEPSSIGFTVRMSFQGGSGQELTLHRTVSVPIQACERP